MKQSQAVQDDQSKITILGVKLDNASVNTLLRRIQGYIARHEKFYIVTPNPEQVMLAQKDGLFKKILNSADVSLPDGVGLVQARKFLSLPNPENKIVRMAVLLIQGIWIAISTIFNRKKLESDFKVIRGREFFFELINLANRKGWKVFLLGGEKGEANKTKKIIDANYKKLKLVAFEGPLLDKNGFPRGDRDKETEKTVIHEINLFSPQILIIGMTAPRQEKWVYRYFDKLDMGGAMMVGGTFRYVSGQVKLPPVLVSNLGLEWLWRLFTGSQKLGRIVNAFPNFPVQIFKYKLLQ